MSNKAFVVELFNCSTVQLQKESVSTKSRETPWDFDQSNTNPVNPSRPLAPAGSWLETQRGGMLTVEAHRRHLVQIRPGTMITMTCCLVDKCWAGRQSHQKIGEVEYDWWSIDMMIWWGDAVCWTWFVGRIVMNCGITKFKKWLEIALPASAVDRWPPARTDRNTSRGGCPVGSDATPSHRKMNWRLSPPAAAAARNGIFGERWVGYGTILKRWRYAKNMHHWRLSCDVSNVPWTGYYQIMDASKNTCPTL